MLNVGLRVVRMGKSSLMYEVGVFQEGSDQVKVSAVDFNLRSDVLRWNLLLSRHIDSF